MGGGVCWASVVLRVRPLEKRKRRKKKRSSVKFCGGPWDEGKKGRALGVDSFSFLFNHGSFQKTGSVFPLGF